MKYLAYLILTITMWSSIIPCHYGEHEHGIECSHQDSDGDSGGDEDHPCSPFCMHHAAFFSQVQPDFFQAITFISNPNESYIFNYKAPQSELRDYSYWHPPKA